MRSEPPLRNPEDVFAAIVFIHGPRRYREYPEGTINGATSRLQAQDNFGLGPGQTLQGHGPGAVYGWFVGSPRAFLFGFERTQGWATRRMIAAMRAEEKLCVSALSRGCGCAVA